MFKQRIKQRISLKAIHCHDLKITIFLKNTQKCNLLFYRDYFLMSQNNHVKADQNLYVSIKYICESLLIKKLIF